MNEEAIKTMYSIAQGEGYGKSIEDFKTLLSSNEEAFNTMYSLAQENGYKKSIEDFSELMDVKKKESTPSDSTGLTQQPPQQQDVVSASSEETSTSLPQESTGDTRIGYKEDAPDLGDKILRIMYEVSTAIGAPEYAKTEAPSALDVKKHEQYNFGESEDLLLSLQNENAIEASKTLETIIDQVSDSDELRERIAESEKEKEKIKSNWSKEKMYGQQVGRWEDSTDYFEYIAITPESVEQKLINEKFTDQFIDKAKPKLIEDLRKNLPEYIINDEEKFKEYLEVATDKLFFENGLNLDLDGDARYNDEAFAIDMYKNLKLGIKGVADPLEYAAYWVASTPMPEAVSDAYLKSKRAESNQEKEKIASSMIQFEHGIANSFANGDIGNGVHQIIGGTVQTLPIIALTAATGGAGGALGLGAFATGALTFTTIGTVSGVGTYMSARDQMTINPETGEEEELYGYAGAMGYAVASGVGEGLFALVGQSIISKAARGAQAGRGGLFGKLTLAAEEAPRLRQILTKETFNNGTLKKQLFEYAKGYAARKGVAMAEEGITEFATGFTESIVERVAAGEDIDFKAALETGIDNAILGASAGAIFESIGGAQKPRDVVNLSLAAGNAEMRLVQLELLDGGEANELTNMSSKIDGLREELKTTNSNTRKIEIAEELNELNTKRQSYIDSRSKVYEKMQVQDKEAFAAFMDESKKQDKILKELIEVSKAKAKATKKGKSTDTLTAKETELKEELRSSTRQQRDILSKFEETTTELTQKEHNEVVSAKLEHIQNEVDQELANAQADLESINEKVAEGGVGLSNEQLDAQRVAEERVERAKRRKAQVKDINTRLEAAKLRLEDAMDFEGTEMYDPVEMQSAIDEVASIENELKETLNITAEPATAVEVEAPSVEPIGGTVEEIESALESEPQRDTDVLPEEEQIPFIEDLATKADDSEISISNDDGSISLPQEVGRYVFSDGQLGMLNTAITSLVSKLTDKGKKVKVIMLSGESAKVAAAKLGEGGTTGFFNKSDGDSIIYLNMDLIQEDAINNNVPIEDVINGVFTEEIIHGSAFKTFFQSASVEDVNNILASLYNIADADLRKAAEVKLRNYLSDSKYIDSVNIEGDTAAKIEAINNMDLDQLIDLVSQDNKGSRELAEEFAIEIVTDMVLTGKSTNRLVDIIKRLLAKIGFGGTDAEAKAFIRKIKMAYAGKGDLKRDVTKMLERQKRKAEEQADGRSRSISREETVSAYNLPEGEFEITFDQAYYRDGLLEGTEPQTIKFNDRSEFVEWWKTYARTPEWGHGNTSWFGSKGKFSVDSEGRGYNKIPEVSNIRTNGKLVDVDELLLDYSRPYSKSEARGRGSAAYYGLKQDIDAAVEAGILTQEQADNINANLASNAFGILKIEKALESESKNRSEWEADPRYQDQTNVLEDSRIAVNRIIAKRAKEAGVDFDFNDDLQNTFSRKDKPAERSRVTAYSAVSEKAVTFESGEEGVQIMLEPVALIANIKKGEYYKSLPESEKAKYEAESVARLQKIIEENIAAIKCAGLSSCSVANKTTLTEVKHEIMRMFYGPELTNQQISAKVVMEDVLFIEGIVDAEGLVQGSPFEFHMGHKKALRTALAEKISLNGLDGDVSPKMLEKLMNVVIAVTSNGNANDRNIAVANQIADIILDNYSNNGSLEIPENKMAEIQGISARSEDKAVIPQLRELNNLIKKHSQKDKLNANALLTELNSEKTYYLYKDKNGHITASKSTPRGVKPISSFPYTKAQEIFGAKIGQYAAHLNGNQSGVVVDLHAKRYFATTTGVDVAFTDEALKAKTGRGMTRYEKIAKELSKRGQEVPSDATEALAKILEIKNEPGIDPKEQKKLADFVMGLANVDAEGSDMAQYGVMHSVASVVSKELSTDLRRAATEKGYVSKVGEAMGIDLNNLTNDQAEFLYGSVEKYNVDKNNSPKFKDFGFPFNVINDYMYASGQVSGGKPYTQNDIQIDSQILTPQDKAAKQRRASEVEQKPIDTSSTGSFLSTIKQPLAGNGTFAHMTAENPNNKQLSPEENRKRNDALEKYLKANKFDYTRIDGFYDRPESSFLVSNITTEQAVEIGKKYKQESVAHSNGMLYTTGENAGKMEPTTGLVDIDISDSPTEGFSKLSNYYSQVTTKEGKTVRYSVDYKWKNFVDIPKTVKVNPDAVVVFSSEYGEARIPFNKKARVINGARFNEVASAVSDFFNGKSDRVESFKVTGNDSDVSSRKKNGVRLQFDPMTDRLPHIPNGGYVRGAEQITEVNGVFYASGKIEMADAKDNFSGKSTNKEVRKANKDGSIDKNYAVAIERLQAMTEKSTETRPTTEEAGEIFDTLSDSDVDALYDDKGAPEIARKERSRAMRGKFIRKTAGKAAAKYGGKTRQKILNNPENYISRQNIKENKDRLHLMTETELIEIMRDSKLGELQNKNDNVSVLASAELIARAETRGDMDEIASLVEQRAKMGTSAGRILRHFRELNKATPEGMTTVIVKAIEQRGNTLSAEQQTRLFNTVKANMDAKAEYDKLKKRAIRGEDVEVKLKRAKKKLMASDKDLSTLTNKWVERGWGDLASMLIQGNLLTIKSQLVNIGANLINVLGNVLVGTIAVPTETLINALGLASSHYKNSYSLAAYLEGAKGFFRGFAEAGQQIFTGQDPDMDSEWRMERGFAPVRSLITAVSGKDLPLNAKGRVSNSMRAKLAVQFLPGFAAEIMFRFLSLGDTPFRRYVEGVELHKMGKSKGLKGEALKKYIKHPNAKDLEFAVREGKKLTFQADTDTSKLAEQGVGYIIKGLGKVFDMTLGPRIIDPYQLSKFLIRAVVPYVKTPANILSETLTYVSPYYGVARMMRDIRNNDARGAAQNFGKIMVGSMASQTAMMLVKEGLISGGIDWDEDEEKNLAYDQFPPYSINVTGLQRWINGESTAKQPDDYFANYNKLGIIGTIFGAIEKGADRTELQNRSYDDMKFLHHAVNDSFGFGAGSSVSHMMDQSFLQGIDGLLSIITSIGEDDWNRSSERFINSVMKSASATVLPNTLSQLHRAQREYMPDYRISKDMDMDERLLKTLEYIIKDRTFNTDGVPIRVDWKGNDIKQTPTGADPTIYHIFDITSARKGEADPVSNEIYRLYENLGDISEVVGTPGYAKKKKLNVPNIKSKKMYRAINRLPRNYTWIEDAEFVASSLYLTTTEINELMKPSGKERYMEIEQLTKTEAYKKANDAKKLEMLNEINEGYNEPLEMDGQLLRPHSIKILDIMQDRYENEQE